MSVPALRFKQDDGQDFPEWDKRRLGDTLSIFSGYAFSSSDAQANGIKWLKIADVGIQVMTPNNPSYLPIELKSKYKNFLVYQNDYVVALTRPILNGKLKIAKVDQSYSESLLNQRVGKLVSNQNVDFIYFILQLENTVSNIADTISGTDPPNLSLNEIKGIELTIPSSINEQTKIANFLTAVDEKIHLLTQKHDLLTQYKKGVMQQIFSQELRFKDDDGGDFPKWDFHEIGKFLVKHDEKSTENNQYPVLTSSRRGIFLQKDYFNGADVASNDNTGYNVVPRNFFTYRHMSDDLIFAFNRNTIVDKGIVSTLYPVFTTRNIDNNFLQIVLNNGNEFKEFAIQQKQGGSRTYMYFTKLEKLEINLPCIAEQTKIANFLTAIDDKITATQTQLQAVKQYKQGLLQQMFV